MTLFVRLCRCALFGGALAGLVDTGAQPASSRPTTGALAAITLLLRDAFPASSPGAAVLIAHRGEVVHRAAYGLADVALRRPLTPDDVFRLGPLTQQFTAVAVLQLVEAGALRLGATLGELLPDTPPAWHAATIEQLLRHTAGIPDHPDPPQSPDSRPGSNTGLIGLACDVPPPFAPGTGFAVSHTGYQLLGAILEHLASARYGEIVAQRLATPAGLTAIATGSNDEPERIRVTGYQRGPAGEWLPAPPHSPIHLHAVSGLVGTVDDLWRWERALTSGRLLDRTLLDRARSAAELPDGRQTGFGYGWVVSRLAGRRAYEHGGATSGFSAYTLSVPEEGLFVALLANTEDPAVPLGLLAQRLARVLVGPWQFVSHAVEVEQLAGYAGTYRIEPEALLRFAVEDGRLVGRRTGGPSFTLVPIAGDTFAVPENETLWLFRRDAAGRVDRVIARPRAGPDAIGRRTEESCENEPLACALPPARPSAAFAERRPAG
jgi:D-alanyl-D-alanine carboxypeptidase